MTDSLLPVVSAVIASAKADATLTAIVGQRIYSNVPDNETFPYCVFSFQSSPSDTKTENGMAHLVTATAYSRKQDIEQVCSIRSAVYNLLHKQETSFNSAGIVAILFAANSPVYRDNDGKTWIAAAQFIATV